MKCGDPDVIDLIPVSPITQFKHGSYQRREASTQTTEVASVPLYPNIEDPSPIEWLQQFLLLRIATGRQTVVPVYDDTTVQEGISADSQKLLVSLRANKLKVANDTEKLEIVNETKILVEPNDVEKIVGGKNARPGQFPYTVSLKVWNQHICGGAIINKNHILTAAHCVLAVTPNIKHVTVVTGTIYRTHGGQSHKVIAMYSSENFNVSTDIGIAKIDGAIDFNAYQQPIALATSRPPPNFYAVVSGWGSTKTPRTRDPNTQKYLYVKMIDSNLCRRIYRHVTTEICTFKAVNHGVCSGDSGSPLVYNGHVVGVTSRGIPCAKGFPDIFTSVYDNLDFIRTKMQT
ncbi:chymotrypsin-1-like [Colletes gigas]|uniref:chymotrypsin-1-like n=1 Tax=Colletes gigas TaxID=935657 RepID=UPI001C9BBCB1|nr:chymotrypsin-1-like [Colletes gigas]